MWSVICLKMVKWKDKLNKPLIKNDFMWSDYDKLKRTIYNSKNTTRHMIKVNLCILLFYSKWRERKHPDVDDAYTSLINYWDCQYKTLYENIREGRDIK